MQWCLAMGVVLVMGFWLWMVMNHGFGWVWVVVGGGFCSGYWYWGEAGLRWWLAVVSRGCRLRRCRDSGRERQRESEK
mgnify:CR=1 FL=1